MYSVLLYISRSLFCMKIFTKKILIDFRGTINVGNTLLEIDKICAVENTRCQGSLLCSLHCVGHDMILYLQTKEASDAMEVRSQFQKRRV